MDSIKEKQEEIVQTVEEQFGTFTNAIKSCMIEEDVTEINGKICDYIDIDLFYKQNTLGVNMHLSLLYLLWRSLSTKRSLKSNLNNW